MFLILVGIIYRDRLGFASTFSASRFLLFFFFFLPAFVDFGRQILLLWTVYALFTHCAYTVHVLKNIKNGSHDTIYTFKYYFATVFSVFSFQFSVFGNNKFNPNTPIVMLIIVFVVGCCVGVNRCFHGVIRWFKFILLGVFYSFFF